MLAANHLAFLAITSCLPGRVTAACFTLPLESMTLIICKYFYLVI